MSIYHINIGCIAPAEMQVLSLSQILVLACVRQLQSPEKVARQLGKETVAIQMMLSRIRKKGVPVAL